MLQLPTRCEKGGLAPEGGAPSLLHEADALHSLLVIRADKLAQCIEGSDEEAELAIIAETIEGYEAKRWPGGKLAGGKG